MPPSFTKSSHVWFTVGLAVAIIGSFIYLGSSLGGLVQVAQDQSIVERTATLQNAFAPLAGELWNQPDVLRSYMQGLQHADPSLVSFDILKPTTADADHPSWVVVLSSDEKRQGVLVSEHDEILSAARADTAHSFTVEGRTDAGSRTFFTARAVVDRSGTFKGVALTGQTLNAGDHAIQKSLERITLTLLMLLVFLLLLFFRHSRLIDYAIVYKHLGDSAPPSVLK